MEACLHEIHLPAQQLLSRSQQLAALPIHNFSPLTMKTSSTNCSRQSCPIYKSSCKNVNLILSVAHSHGGSGSSFWMEAANSPGYVVATCCVRATSRQNFKELKNFWKNPCALSP